MARPSQPRVVDSSDDDDDDISFPDLATLLRQKPDPSPQTQNPPKIKLDPKPQPTAQKKTAVAAASVRRRKLGKPSDDTLLRAWTPNGATEVDDAPRRATATEGGSQTRGLRVELRTRKARPTEDATPRTTKEEEAEELEDEEVTITEDVSLIDDEFMSAESDTSDFDIRELVSDHDDDDSVVEIVPSRPPPKPRFRETDARVAKKSVPTAATTKTAGSRSSEEPVKDRKPRKETAPKKQGTAGDLTDSLARLQLHDLGPETATRQPRGRKVTPPSSPSKTNTGLISPKKLSRIPSTPHRPNTDMFWSQEFVDDWNDEHSPRKQLFPDASKASPTKPSSPEKKKATTAIARDAKKAFEQAKHAVAEAFLAELDKTITNGQLASLSASTGGIKLLWSNKLNTTAGRANWKRETVRTITTTPNGQQQILSVTYKHHASIELAEKVIDDQNRLLNVIAHEFCHLANFMVSNMTTNPHGKEFKAWAARVSAAFGASHNIAVTTKHTYEIDFKYVWECASCGLEYKRHSKSVHPERHRCGACKGELRQTKPVPRGKGEGAGEGGKPKPSAYQEFMKAEMKKIREENPGNPQKDIMKLVAARWAVKQGEKKTASQKSTPDSTLSGVMKGMELLTVDDD